MKNLFPVNLVNKKRKMFKSKLNSHGTAVFAAKKKGEKGFNYFPVGDRWEKFFTISMQEI